MFRPLTALDRLLAIAEKKLEKLQYQLIRVQEEIDQLQAAIAIKLQEEPKATPPREKGK